MQKIFDNFISIFVKRLDYLFVGEQNLILCNAETMRGPYNSLVTLCLFQIYIGRRKTRTINRDALANCACIIVRKRIDPKKTSEMT